MLPSLRKRVLGLLQLGWFMGVCLGASIGSLAVRIDPNLMVPITVSCGLVGVMLLILVLVGWQVEKRDLDD